MPAEGGGNVALHKGAEHLHHVLPQVFPIQHLLPLGVDDLTLGVHDVIVFQNVLSCAEVPGFYALLGVFHGVAEDFRVDGGILVQTKRVHHAHHPVGGEQAHQIVL